MITPEAWLNDAPKKDAPKEAHQQWKAQMEIIYASNIQAQPAEYRELYVMPESEVLRDRTNGEDKDGETR